MKKKTKSTGLQSRNTPLKRNFVNGLIFVFEGRGSAKQNTKMKSKTKKKGSTPVISILFGAKRKN